MENARVSAAQDLLKEVGVVLPFPGSQFPYPLNQSLFGELNLESLRRSIKDIDGSRLEEELPVLLALAETVEASQSDKKEFFVADRELRARLVRLNSTDGWDDVANTAAGKQSSGYAAFGRDYLRSRKFLQADGGWKRIVWMSQELKEQFAPDKTWIATEANVTNLPELMEFIRTNRGR